MVFALTACYDGQPDGTGGRGTPVAGTPKPGAQGARPPLNTNVSTGRRDYRVHPIGGGEDVVTLMVYLCGSDLESENGAATDDLEEIMAADISGRLNIVVETGGAFEWQNDFVNPRTNQRWLITNDGIELLQDVGMRDMSRSGTLQDFVAFAADAYPADRYMLILWDHGGGTVDGYAYDERYDSYDMMPIIGLDDALQGAGVVFDMIGFDCCLMGTIETAFIMDRHADYMVASQWTEPGGGWHYTPWVQALSQNTSIPTAELGQIIVDSFIPEEYSDFYGDERTLAVTDLTYIAGLFESLTGFLADAQQGLVPENTFISAAKAIGDGRAMVDDYDLVDLKFIADAIGGSDELIAELDNCVVYSASNVDNQNGLSFYLPYSDLLKVGSAVEILDEIGLDETYRDFITTFANLMVGGQIHSGGGNSNPLSGKDDFDSDYWLSLGWVDSELFDDFEEFYIENDYDASELYIWEKAGNYVLSFSEEDWELITSVELRVFLDDGEGYIDLGADSVYEFDDDGDLLIVFDNTWVALDGELVCFYVTDEFNDGNYWQTRGRVPILYQNKEAELVLVWDGDHPNGYVAGWRYTTVGGGSQRGLFEVHEGMTFDFLCDYYTYDGDYEDKYVWGGMSVGESVKVSYEDVGDDDCLVFYVLGDIYGNTYWTEPVIYSMDW